jgi:hypothetical protein
MARQVVDVPTSKSQAEVEQVVTSFMTSEGFTRARYGRYEVWKKGHGFSMPQFLTADAVDGKVHIEAWLKYPILPGVYVGGELDTGSGIGFVMRKKLRDRVERLEGLLKQ